MFKSLEFPRLTTLPLSNCFISLVQWIYKPICSQTFQQSKNNQNSVIQMLLRVHVIYDSTIANTNQNCTRESLDKEERPKRWCYNTLTHVQVWDERWMESRCKNSLKFGHQTSNWSYIILRSSENVTSTKQLQNKHVFSSYSRVDKSTDTDNAGTRIWIYATKLQIEEQASIHPLIHVTSVSIHPSYAAFWWRENGGLSLRLIAKVSKRANTLSFQLGVAKGAFLQKRLNFSALAPFESNLESAHSHEQNPRIFRPVSFTTIPSYCIALHCLIYIHCFFWLWIRIRVSYKNELL